MFKRLSFAVVAVSFTVPVVACLHQNEEPGGAVAHLDEATKAACNFAYTTVDTAGEPEANKVTFGDKPTELLPAMKVAFGKFDKEDGIDFVVVKDASHLQGYTSKGGGKFGLGKPSKNINKMSDRKRDKKALSIAAVGDFDGDGHTDTLVAETSTKKDPATEGPDDQVNYRVVYGTEEGDFAIHNQTDLPTINEKVLFHVVGDLDGDKADDIVIVTATTQTAIFSNVNPTTGIGNRFLRPAPATPNAAVPRLAFYAPKTATNPAAALVIATDDKVTTQTFAVPPPVQPAPPKNAQPAAPALPVATLASELPWTGFTEGASRVVSDLDSNGKNEVALFSDKLAIAALGAGKKPAAPLTFADVKGHAKAALQLKKVGPLDLVFSALDHSKLYAACGYSPTAQAIGAVELPIAYSDKTFIGGTPDLNGDGRADFVTFSSDAPDFPKVYLSLDPNVESPLEVKVYASNLFVEPPVVKDDAGGDAAAEVDSGTTEPPVEVDSGTTKPPVEVDSGTTKPPVEEDSGTTEPPVEVDSGTTNPPVVDSGTTNPPVVDSGTTNPPAPKPDSGTGPDNGKPGPGIEEPPPSENSGKKPTGSATGATKTGTGSVTVRPQPTQEPEEGCAMTPGSTNSAPSTSAIAGLLAAMTLLGRRRKKN